MTTMALIFGLHIRSNSEGKEIRFSSIYSCVSTNINAAGRNLSSGSDLQRKEQLEREAMELRKRLTAVESQLARVQEEEKEKREEQQLISRRKEEFKQIHQKVRTLKERIGHR